MEKIFNLDQLAFLLKTTVFQKKTKVLVTGCFDLLHQEHHRFLEKAKNSGDWLIVGLESDQRVKSLKGESRPLHSQVLRAQALASLPSVDLVFILPQDFGQPQSRQNLLQLIQPRILAISQNDPLKNQKEKECRLCHCQVKVVYPYNSGLSTTKIIKGLTNLTKSL